MKPFPYQQVDQSDTETDPVQQVEQTPTDSGTKGGTKSTSGTSGSGTRGGFFNRFWRYRRPQAVKPQIVKADTVPDTLSVSAASTSGSAVVQHLPGDGSQDQFVNSGFIDPVPVQDHNRPHRGMPWNWVFWNNQAQQQPVDPAVAPVPVVGVTHPVEVSFSNFYF